jgi:hypothetical protein
MKIVEKQIKDLIEAEYNPRRLTEIQYKQLKDSLLRFGIVDPVLVNTNEERKNIIIGGHQRTRVWGDLGNETIPCVELDLTLDQEKELNVRLNKNTGEFDFDMLNEFFDEDNLVDWGFDSFQFDTEDEVDYSILDDEDLSDDLEDMTAGVKKAIQIEFDLEHYEEAQELVKFWRDQDSYIGAMLIEKLKQEKEKL